MKKILFLLFFLLIILVLPTVVGWGPVTHFKLSKELLEDNTTIVGQMCNKNELTRSAFYLGSCTPDLSVIFYYEKGGEKYRLTHNFLFQQKLTAQAKTEDEKCFCAGVSSHLIQDSVAHTMAVPKAIEEKHLPNWLIHPLLEKKYDSALSTTYPEIKEPARHVMDALDGPKGDRYIEMIEEALGENADINVRSEMTKLQIAVGGGDFYQTQYKPSGNVLLFKAYPCVNKLTDWLAPFIGTINFGNVDYYYEKSKELTVSTFNNFGMRYQLSPHGFSELSAANDKTGSSLTIILIISLIIPLGLAIYRKNYLYLFLIPIFLIGIIVGIYAML